MEKVKREIPKLPDVPKLTNKQIQLLTELCFRQDNPEKADAIFVFGTSIGIKETVDALEYLICNNFSNIAIISGGVNNFIGSKELCEADSETIYNLIKDRSAQCKFYLEKLSINTLENVINSKDIINSLNCKIMIYLCRSFCAGRCFLTLRRIFPTIKFLQYTYSMPSVNSGRLIESNNWFEFEEGKQRVWGEYLRIKFYGEKNDIEYSSVKKVIEEIGSL